MEGGCHCGKVRFKTSAKPYWIGACYCIDCRKITGSPYSVFAAFKEGEVEFTGIPKQYSSSKEVTRSFCAECSAPFAYTYNTRPKEYFVPVGIFDDPSHLVPRAHIWVSQKLPWVLIHDDLPQEQ